MYVQAFSGDGKVGLIGARLQVSNTGGSRPVWRKDGRELYYQALDGTIMAADVQLSPPLRVERPRALFRANLYDRLHAYAVSADAKRFLLVQTARGTPEPLHLNVVTNWRRRMVK